jgi:hypothetical protein
MVKKNMVPNLILFSKIISENRKKYIKNVFYEQRGSAWSGKIL